MLLIHGKTTWYVYVIYIGGPRIESEEKIEIFSPKSYFQHFKLRLISMKKETRQKHDFVMLVCRYVCPRRHGD